MDDHSLCLWHNVYDYSYYYSQIHCQTNLYLWITCDNDYSVWHMKKNWTICLNAIKSIDRIIHIHMESIDECNFVSHSNQSYAKILFEVFQSIIKCFLHSVIIQPKLIFVHLRISWFWQHFFIEKFWRCMTCLSSSTKIIFNTKSFIWVFKIARECCTNFVQKLIYLMS